MRSKDRRSEDLVITFREIIIIGLTGTRYPECGEQYFDTKSGRKALEITKKFRKPAIVSKR